MDSSVESQLSQIERDRMAVYLKRSRPSWWYLPVVAIATALMIATHDLDNRALEIVLVLIYAVGMGALAGVTIRSGGAVPRFSSMPRPLLVPVIAYMVAIGAAMLAAWTFAERGDVSYTIAGIGVGLVMWLGGWVTFLVTERRAERLARELGIER